LAALSAKLNPAMPEPTTKKSTFFIKNKLVKCNLLHIMWINLVKMLILYKNWFNIFQ